MKYQDRRTQTRYEWTDKAYEEKRAQKKQMEDIEKVLKNQEELMKR